MVLFKKRIAEALIRLRGCAGWSAPLLFANSRRQVFSRRGPLGLHYKKENGIVLPRHFRKAYHSSVKMSTQLFVPINMFCIHSESVVQGTVFTFSKQTFNESYIFTTTHCFMNDTNLIKSCQAHLPIQYASNIECIRQK